MDLYRSRERAALGAHILEMKRPALANERFMLEDVEEWT
jgi:hypothetical protein